MKVFYTGSTGSLGQYFRSSLIKLGIDGQALHSRLEDRGALARELESKLETASPQTKVCLVQMSALVSVAACEQDPPKAFKTNVTDTLETVSAYVHLAKQLEAVPSVVYVSTGHVYKAPSERRPVNEDDELAPRSVYARTKLEAEQQLKELADRLDFQLLIGRVFGLVAPRQPSHYVLPGLIRRVQTATLANIPGLDFCRDYLDARDVCDALAELCTIQASKLEAVSVVNICSGKAVSLRSLMEEIIRALQPDNLQEMLLSLSAGPGRPDDVPWLVGSCDRYQALTGRMPQRISLAQTIRDALSEGSQRSQD